MLGAVLLLTWFNQSFGQAIKAAEHFADDLAGCNLTTSVATGFAPPMDSLIRSLRQIQINLRAVVGDVRGEIETFTQSAAEIAAGKGAKLVPSTSLGANANDPLGLFRGK